MGRIGRYGPRPRPLPLAVLAGCPWVLPLLAPRPLAALAALAALAVLFALAALAALAVRRAAVPAALPREASVGDLGMVEALNPAACGAAPLLAAFSAAISA